MSGIGNSTCDCGDGSACGGGESDAYWGAVAALITTVGLLMARLAHDFYRFARDRRERRRNASPVSSS